MEGRVTEAQRMAEFHDVDYMHSKKKTTEDEFSTEDYLNKGNSELNLWLYYDEGDKKIVTVYAEMDNKYWDLLDSADPKDGLAVTWSDTYWQPVSQSASNVTLFGDTQYIEYEDYKTHGVWAKVDDQDHVEDVIGDDNINVGFTTELEKLDDTNEYNINAEYMHNWNLGGLYWISSFSLGPVGLNLSGINIDDWRLETTEKI